MGCYINYHILYSITIYRYLQDRKLYAGKFSPTQKCVEDCQYQALILLCYFNIAILYNLHRNETDFFFKIVHYIILSFVNTALKRTHDLMHMILLLRIVTKFQ